MMNPEAEFYPRKKQQDTNHGAVDTSGTTATATPPDPSSEAMPRHGSDPAPNGDREGGSHVDADDTSGDLDSGPVSGAVSDGSAARDTAASATDSGLSGAPGDNDSGLVSGDVSDHSADRDAGASATDPGLSGAPNGNGEATTHEHSHNPGNTATSTGGLEINVNPGAAYHHNPAPATDAAAGPAPGPVFGPTYDPNVSLGEYYHYQNPGFDNGYAAPMYQMNYQPPPPPLPPLPPQPMYHHAPMDFYNQQPYPVYPAYPAYSPNHTPNGMANHFVPNYHHPQYAYPTNAYTPSAPVYAGPPPPPPPSRHMPHIHGPKAFHGYRNSSSYSTSPATSPTRRGEMGDPEAKIFVGDLPIGSSTLDLESCLRSMFLPFGPCWVNVSWGETTRNGGDVKSGDVTGGGRVKKLPTGWVQYQEVSDAERVFKKAKERGIYIGTRRLRIERADGKRIVRLWPKDPSAEITLEDLRTEFRRFMAWLTPQVSHKLLYHISDCTEPTKKMNHTVLSVGVMFRWCEDAQYAAKRFNLFQSNFDMHIEPVRTMTGTPSWRKSKVDCAAPIDKIELSPVHEWHENTQEIYVEVIDDIEAKLEESPDEDGSSGESHIDASPRRARANSSASSSESSGTVSSPSTLEDVEEETWEENSDTVVALSHSETSGREETRDEIRMGKMAAR